MTILAYDARRLRQALGSRRRHPNWRRVVICVSIAYAALIGARQVVAYERLHARMASVVQQLTQVRRQDARLKQEIAFAHSPAYVRQAAQNELGLVPPGEVPFQPLPQKP